MEASAAERYARGLLADAGAPAQILARTARPSRPEPPDLAWARSGAMALTGPAGAAPLLAPGPFASAADGAARALRALAPRLAPLDAPALLGERAALAGLGRRGAVAPGGGCRLLRARGGWVAVHLARDDDRTLLPAWLEEDDPGGDAWAWLTAAVARRGAGALVERARLLGLAAAPAAAEAPRGPWLRVAARGRARAPSPRPLVLDLSALWAGPLCAQLLGLAGARVVKVESPGRPDGARADATGFFDRLHAGHESVALDLSDASGVDRLAALLRRADAVIESSRPRALAQLGIDAAALVAERPGLVWLSITAYGRADPHGTWVGFGDDAAAAAGVAVATGAADAPLFCGDALADPLTGLHAAVAALAALRSGAAVLLDVSLCAVAANALRFDATVREACVEEDAREGLRVRLGGRTEPVRPPRARPPAGRARPLGADTLRVLGELGVPC